MLSHISVDFPCNESPMILNTKRAQDKKLVHYRGDYSAFKKMHLQQKATMDKEFKKQQDHRCKGASGFASEELDSGSTGLPMVSHFCTLRMSSRPSRKRERRRHGDAEIAAIWMRLPDQWDQWDQWADKEKPTSLPPCRVVCIRPQA